MSSGPKPEQPDNAADAKNESLAQRSARLEAEAASGLFGAKHDDIPSVASTHESRELEQKNAALQDELNKTKDQLLRALADGENIRKRSVKDREDASRYAVTSFAKELLSVADNLRRALDAIPAEAMAADPHLKNLNDGVTATERELLKSFEKHGIKKIVPLDEPFNPNFHEVMFEAPGTGKPAGTVVQVMEAGYVLNDRLLRPARVAVAKNEGQDRPGGQIDTSA